jgi:glycosyltransferase involved in cell wall biosynthesis
VLALGAEHLDWQAGSSPGPSSVGETLRLRRLIGERGPTLVHLHSSKPGLAGRLALRGRVPTVFQPHGWSFYPLSGLMRKAAIAWERAGARWADAVACVSESERRRGEAAGIRARWEVVPNGVDVRSLPPASDRDRATARRELQLPDGPLVVCLGRICRAKGQDQLVEAWPRVLERVPEATLALVGGGPDFEAVRNLPAERVLFAGERTDAPAWLAAADVVAAPSRWEGMSFAMLETMASARSLVMTDVPGARDALGDHAGIVPLGDLQALAGAIVERLLDPALAAQEGAAARLRVERDHDLRDTTNGVALLYGRVLGVPLAGLEEARIAAAG